MKMEIELRKLKTQRVKVVEFESISGMDAATVLYRIEVEDGSHIVLNATEIAELQKILIMLKVKT